MRVPGNEFEDDKLMGISINAFYEPFYTAIIAASKNMYNSIEAVKEAKSLRPNEIINENIFILTSAEYAGAIVEAVKYKTNYKPAKNKMTNIDIIKEGIKVAEQVKISASNAIKESGGIGAKKNKKINLNATDAKMYNDGERAGIYAAGIVIADMFINKFKKELTNNDIKKLSEVDINTFLFAFIIINNSMSYINRENENTPFIDKSTEIVVNNYNKLKESKIFDSYYNTGQTFKENYIDVSSLMHFTSSFASMLSEIPRNKNETNMCDIDTFNTISQRCNISTFIYICNFYNSIKTDQNIRDIILPLVSGYSGWGKINDGQTHFLIDKKDLEYYKKRLIKKNLMKNICKETQMNLNHMHLKHMQELELFNLIDIVKQFYLHL